MSIFNQNLKTIDTKHKGKGIIASVDLPANAVIYEFRGKVFTGPNLHYDDEFILQIGANKFMGPSGDLDDLMNHSCNPNCGFRIVGSRVLLVSLYVIKANTEITYDYSITSTDTLDEWKMECKCGEFKCRKVISGYQYLDKSVKENYEKLGIVPSYNKGK